jgi:hypothetical protein
MRKGGAVRGFCRRTAKILPNGLYPICHSRRLNEKSGLDNRVTLGTNGCFLKSQLHAIFHVQSGQQFLFPQKKLTQPRPRGVRRRSPVVVLSGPSEQAGEQQHVKCKSMTPQNWRPAWGRSENYAVCMQPRSWDEAEWDAVYV